MLSNKECILQNDNSDIEITKILKNIPIYIKNIKQVFKYLSKVKCFDRFDEFKVNVINETIL